MLALVVLKITEDLDNQSVARVTLPRELVKISITITIAAIATTSTGTVSIMNNTIRVRMHSYRCVGVKFSASTCTGRHMWKSLVQGEMEEYTGSVS